jgi:hypothetical protein
MNVVVVPKLWTAFANSWADVTACHKAVPILITLLTKDAVLSQIITPNRIKPDFCLT